jgi:hypothetical protein
VALTGMETNKSIQNGGSGESRLDFKHEGCQPSKRSIHSQSLANILRQIPSLAEVSSKLAKGQSYKAYIPPDVLKRLRDGSARLAERDNGTLAANILDSNTGEIVANASLVEVSPELMGSLAQLATQQALADIAYRLEVIGEKISAVLEGQHGDRIALVQSGIDIYNQAIAASSENERRQLLVASIQSLNEGKSKLLQSADLSFVNNIPRGKIGMILQFGRNIPKEIEGKSKSALESLWHIIRATQYLTMAYSALREPESLAICIEQSRLQLEELQRMASELARWLPPSEGVWYGLTAFASGNLPSKNELDQLESKGIVVDLLPFNMESN